VDPYTTASDVYSLGVVLWELLTCAVPFDGASFMDLVRRVGKEGEHPPIPRGTPRRFASLLRATWHPDPARRPSALRVVDALRKIQEELEAATATAAQHGHFSGGHGGHGGAGSPPSLFQPSSSTTTTTTATGSSPPPPSPQEPGAPASSPAPGSLKPLGPTALSAPHPDPGDFEGVGGTHPSADDDDDDVIIGGGGGDEGGGGGDEGGGGGDEGGDEGDDDESNPYLSPPSDVGSAAGGSGASSQQQPSSLQPIQQQQQQQQQQSSSPHFDPHAASERCAGLSEEVSRLQGEAAAALGPQPSPVQTAFSNRWGI
jgi:serine/threonine protein kinase